MANNNRFHSDLSKYGRISIPGLTPLEFEIAVGYRFGDINSETGE
jgi:hypothetical protein